MRLVTSFLAAAVLGFAPVSSAGAQESVVKAVFFYSPTCPHCHQVSTEVLPPLRQQYGERLVVVGVDVSTRSGQDLYQATVAYFALPESRLGVPTLVVGTDVMVGSLEIPQRFPRTIEWGLGGSGIDWPPVPEIRQALTAQGLLEDRPGAAAAEPEPAPPADTTAPAEEGAATLRDTAGAAPTETVAPSGTVASGGASDTPRAGDTAAAPGEMVQLSGAGLIPDTALQLERPTVGQLFRRDPLGNGIAVAVLLLLLGTILWSLRTMVRPGDAPRAWPRWVFPVLGVVGAGIAAYLSFVEVTGAEAVCGPVGDCNTVQQSSWARIFGVLPIGVLGLAGYAGMLAAWALATWGPASVRHRAWTAAWAMAFVGTVFSAWLTFLEPFVIGATCAWCVSSAVAIALMLAAATARAARPAAA